MKFFFLKRTRTIFFVTNNFLLKNNSSYNNALNSGIIKNYYLSGLSHSYIQKFIKINLKKGLKKKVKIIFSKIFSIFFNFFKNTDIITHDLQNLLEMQSHNFLINKNLYFLNIFLKSIYFLLKPTFIIKFLKNKNKKIKKNDIRYKKYISKIEYVFPEKRENIAFKWLYLYSNHFLDKKFFLRMFKSLFYTFLEKKNSFLYLKKIETYIRFTKIQGNKKK